MPLVLFPYLLLVRYRLSAYLLLVCVRFIIIFNNLTYTPVMTTVQYFCGNAIVIFYSVYTKKYAVERKLETPQEQYCRVQRGCVCVHTFDHSFVFDTLLDTHCHALEKE